MHKCHAEGLAVFGRRPSSVEKKSEKRQKREGGERKRRAKGEGKKSEKGVKGEGSSKVKGERKGSEKRQKREREGSKKRDRKEDRLPHALLSTPHHKQTLRSDRWS
jgi:hypothetical protein